MKKQTFIAHLKREEIPENPRTAWDNLGHMICVHHNYNLGDEQSGSLPGYGEYSGYEEPEDDFLTWVFSEFMQTSETCPKILEDWYANGHNVVLCKDGKNLEEIWLEDFIPKTFKAAIHEWMQENLCVLPLYLYDHSGITMNTTGFSCGWDSGQVGYIYVTKYTWVKETKQEFSQEAARKALEAEVETYDHYLTGEVYGKILYRIYDEPFDISRNISLLESNPSYDLYIGDYGFSIGEYDEYAELDACWGYYGLEQAKQSCKEEFPDMCLSLTKMTRVIQKISEKFLSVFIVREL